MISPTAPGRVSRVRVATALCIASLSLVVSGCAETDTARHSPITEVAQPRSGPPRDLSIYRGLPDVPPPPSSTVSCSYVRSGDSGRATPPATASTTGSVELTLETSIGPVPLLLDRAQAPCTVNNLVALAEQGFYDGTSCHRLATDPGGQLYQCGDPTGTGTGGPGYTFADEYPVPIFAAEAANAYLPPAVIYPRGTVAMANSGVENSNGSQFFLLLGDSLLRPDFTAFGRIADAGMPVLDAAAAQGHDGSSPLGGGVPNTAVVIGAIR